MENSAFFEEHKNQLWFMTLRQFLRHKMAVFGMIIMAVIILMVVFVDQIVPYDPETPDLNNMLSPPSLQHPFGTDELGRDMFTRTMHGGRVSLIVGVFAMLVGVIIGTLIGAIAGYFGGTIDNLLMRFICALGRYAVGRIRTGRKFIRPVRRRGFSMGCTQ